MRYDVPILFLIFNRLDSALRVFEQIRRARPARLFIAADGPRHGKEADVEQCRHVREEIMKMIDWSCDVRTLFRDENLGCGAAPADAITWFFTEVEWGIVLEDDCLPSPSFFSFCRTLLHRYADDERIMMVSGFNAMGTWHPEENDYFFSEGSIWGWASWRRAWKKYDYHMTLYSQAGNKEYLDSIIEAKYPGSVAAYHRILNGANDVWDYQWHFARFANNGLSITPAVNLIENIGFGEMATHTKWIHHPYRDHKAGAVPDILRHNAVLMLDTEYARAIKEKDARPLTISERIKNKLAALLRSR